MKKSLLVAAAAGAATVLGFAPFGWFVLPFVTLAVLFLLWQGAVTARYAAAIGYAWGLGFFLTGVSWVYVSMHDVGGMIMPLAAFATLLFCAYLALYPALAGYCFKRFSTPSRWCNALLLASLWALSEWLRGWVLTGFPWLSLGYSQVNASPLAGYAPIIGGYGITLLLAFIAALMASNWWRPYVLLLIVLLLVAGDMSKQVEWTMPVGRSVSVSLLQGNIPQGLKWDPARLDYSLDTYRQLAANHPAQIVVLPETAIPQTLDEISPDYLRELAGDHNLLLGVVVRNRDGYVNAVAQIGRAGLQGGYAKRHLVPFGEYVPPGFSWFFDWVEIPMTDFSVGARHQAPLDVAGLAIAPNVCYEDAFGEEIIRQLPAATVLLNVSNTAWFGDSLAQPQHLQMSRMRAMETGRPMLRATNTGMTAAITPKGDVIEVLPAFTTDALTVSVQGYTGATPYVMFGDRTALTLALLMLAGAMLHWRKASRRQAPQ